MMTYLLLVPLPVLDFVKPSFRMGGPESSWADDI